MAKILDGKLVRNEIAEALKKKLSKLKEKPCIVVIQVGDLAESNAYIGQKKLLGERIGAKFIHLRVPGKVSENKLLSTINGLNKDKKVHGIIVQMPIPAGLNKEKITEAIDPMKDVDGLHSKNVSKLWQGIDEQKNGYTPATVRGIMSILSYYKFPIKGKHVVIIGRSVLVGKPAALSFLNQDATVTIAHRHSKNLSAITKEADILIVATGVPNLIKKEHVNKNQIIIDVGINVLSGKLQNKKLEDEISAPKLVGDVDFKNVSKIVKAITPVPGGVGPMTVASLFENLLDAYGRQSRKSKVESRKSK